MKYWYIYSSLDWEAQLIKAPDDWLPEHESPDFRDQYFGPFKKLSDAKREVTAKIKDDISSFKGMLEELKFPRSINQRTKLHE